MPTSSRSSPGRRARSPASIWRASPEGPTRRSTQSLGGWWPRVWRFVFSMGGRRPIGSATTTSPPTASDASSQHRLGSRARSARRRWGGIHPLRRSPCSVLRSTGACLLTPRWICWWSAQIPSTNGTWPGGDSLMSWPDGGGSVVQCGAVHRNVPVGPPKCDRSNTGGRRCASQRGEGHRRRNSGPSCRSQSPRLKRRVVRTAALFEVPRQQRIGPHEPVAFRPYPR